MKDSINKIIEYFHNLPEVKRLSELEHYMDTNKDINTYLEHLKAKQKQLINAKEFHQKKQYEVYLKEYNEIKNKLMDLPFVEEYLELINYIDTLLNDFSYEVESKLSRLINR